MVIAGGRVLLPSQGLVACEVRIADGLIAEIGSSVSRAGADVMEAEGVCVLPGIVDIHGDAFERQIMPRPGARFPLDLAFLETDRQLCANGITTAYHALTVSWEPGLRSLAEAERTIEALDRLEPYLGADTRLHIRWETFAIDEAPAVINWLGRARRPLLAFNDHTTTSIEGLRKPVKMKGSAERAGLTSEDYEVALRRAWDRRDEVEDAVKAVAAMARAMGAPMLSHDDMTPDMRRAFRSMGARVAEFPMNWETLVEAGDSGDDIVLGAPNVVRGGSHNGAIGAADAILAGRCSVLASDYYYPALAAAAFKLSAMDGMDLQSAWALVSENPARACGLDDRGTIAVGRRADLVLVSTDERNLPRVRATFRAGALVFSDCHRTFARA